MHLWGNLCDASARKVHVSLCVYPICVQKCNCEYYVYFIKVCSNVSYSSISWVNKVQIMLGCLFLGKELKWWRAYRSAASGAYKVRVVDYPNINKIKKKHLKIGKKNINYPSIGINSVKYGNSHLCNWYSFIHYCK